MGRKCFLTGILAIMAISVFAQDTVYLDKRRFWLDNQDNAVGYAVQNKLAEDSIEVKFYNLEDRLLSMSHYSVYGRDVKNNIRNGIAETYYPDGSLLSRVTYVNNQREGEYQRFYREGQLKYTCQVENDRRVGIITMYYPNGSLMRTEEFRKGRPTGKGHLYDSEGNEIPFYPSERQVEFPGGATALYEFIDEHLHYPKEAVESKVEGRIIVLMKFNKKGKMVHYELAPKGSDNFYLRKEVVRFVEEDLKPVTWLPAVRYGEFVNTSYAVPITFNIPKKNALKK